MGDATESISGSDGTFAAYVASPISNGLGAVIVLHEMFGVNAFMRGASDAIAAQGYFVACPDLYWRQSPGEELSDGSLAEIERGLGLLNAFDREAALRDVADTCRYLRDRLGGTHKIGAVGYCLGGSLAYLAAARGIVDCAVSYYGSEIHEHLDLRDAIARPLLLHVAGRDRTTPADAADRISDAFATHPYVRVHVYADQDHAFARVGTKYFRYEPNAAELANERTKHFLGEQLKH